jgi:LuxR family maltose regulon positive regulatory protein
MQDLAVPIIRSKLYTPQIAPGVIDRARLAALASAVAETPITLISAPAGYGKSTLASQWLAAIDIKSSWYSIDPADSNLRQFLAYVIAAVRQAFPDCCMETAQLLELPVLPAAEELAGVVCNEIDRLDAPLVLVLDDYHNISGPAVHKFLDAILMHPPRQLHLVIVTRRDPPLSLQRLRASGMLTEVRMQQLALSEAEFGEVVRGALGDRAGSGEIGVLYERIEGWPAGLRLALLAAPGASADEFLARIPSGAQAVRAYLVHEVLASCPPVVRDYLLRTSFLDRFCASLAEAIIESGDADSTRMSGAEFIRRIKEAGFFTIPLDSHQKWYRYHHLFQAMLQDEAVGELGEAKIAEIRRRASHWFEEQGLFEEAIQQLLKLDDGELAATLIIRHRNAIMNAEQWHRLDAWLRQLPGGLVNSRPELLLLRARQLRSAGAIEEVQKCVELAQALLPTASVDDRMRRELLGSIESTRCYLLYVMSNGRGAVDAARKALELLPPDGFAERGFAAILLGGGLQMIGELDEALSTLYRTLSDPASMVDRSPTLKSRVLMALGFIYWMHGDLNALEPVLGEIVSLASQDGLREVLTVARSYQAALHYQRNELAAVQAKVAELVASHVIGNAEFHLQCLILSSLSHQALGDSQRASEVMATAKALAARVRNVLQTAVVDAFAADLAFRQGRLSEARQWADRFESEPLIPMYAPVSPALVLARLLVLDEREGNVERAQALLERLVAYLAETHNNRFLAEALALRAILRDRLGDASGATDDLERAVFLAQPGRFIRLFVDLGPAAGRLLGRLDLDEEGVQYVGEILAAFTQRASDDVPDAAPVPAEGMQVGLETLSKREQQILTLLSQRLSNKEIADKLHLAPVTVKRHAANIYEKLGVHSRRQAVAKATGLGLLGETG